MPMPTMNRHVVMFAVLVHLAWALVASAADRRPNIIFILSDDLAQGDVGCYGQRLIKTPNIDRLAAEGIRFTQGYCGTSVCAPSRASLMTGLHSGHCPIRANREVKPEGQFPLPKGAVTVAQLLKDAGYTTACVGKWGMGMFDTTGSPLACGFDHFYGYNCQRHAHSYFPTYLYDDDRRFELPGNTGQGVGRTYAQELIQADALKWIRRNARSPFFLYYAVTLPHARHEIDDQGIYANEPWTEQEKTYAAMVTRLDSDVGKILAELEELGIDDDTLILLAGDNGSSFSPSSPLGTRFKQGDNGLRGFKRSLYEGALRQAAIARWPGVVPANAVRDEPWAFWDFLPTAVELAGAKLPEGVRPDGVSLVSMLRGGPAPARDCFYWELHEGATQQAVRFGDWKAVRNRIDQPLELYDLSVDRAESHDVAATNPDVVARAEAFMRAAHTVDPNWPMKPATKKGTPRASAGAATEGSAPAIHDVVVYGDSSGAAVAAIAARREGRSVVWVNPTGFAGGMTASGLGATDFLGYRHTFGGIASEFYDGVAKAYGETFVRSFEPHVGKMVFDRLLADAGVTIHLDEKLDRGPGKGVVMDGNRIRSISTLSGKTFHGRMFIDAGYVGDLMAAAGVSHTVGREPESRYGEDMAGVRRGDTIPRVHYGQKDKDHFVKDVDPYVTPGDPTSGLLPHVHAIEGLRNGEGDRKIQAYTYRVCLTSDPDNRRPIEKPSGYREIDHELLLRNFDAGDTRMPALIEPLAGPGRKVDWNNMHAVGSDYVGANWGYPEAGYERRREIEKEHERYIRGFLWTLATNPRVPESIRTRTAAYGLPKDEFIDNGGWPWMIYIREARRMVSDYVMTQLDCEGTTSAADPVGLGSFGMDSHCVQHFVTDKGTVQNEGVIWRTPPRPYGISYRSIVPGKGECENLFVPVCLSASHVAHGSIRMEPVFMTLSQSAAIAAGLAIDGGIPVQDVPYPALKAKLETAGQVLHARPAKRRSGL
jgi:arylsulfatase A-like enzyme